MLSSTPEFVDGKYAFYTRPQDGFINAGSGGGVGFGLSDSITNAVVEKEDIIDPRIYHSINEAKNGLGPAPIKTRTGLAAPRARRPEYRRHGPAVTPSISS